MNKRVVAILAVLAAVIGAAALYTRQREETARPAPVAQLGQKLFKDLKADAIARIVIRAPAATLTLEKYGQGWIIRERNGFPADLGKIKDLVVKAIEFRIGQVVPIGADDRARPPSVAFAGRWQGCSRCEGNHNQFPGDRRQAARRAAGRQEILQERNCGRLTACAGRRAFRDAAGGPAACIHRFRSFDAGERCKCRLDFARRLRYRAYQEHRSQARRVYSVCGSGF